MIGIVNAILECLVTGLFTALFLVIATRHGWFPIMLVQTMSLEEYTEAMQEEEDEES